MPAASRVLGLLTLVSLTGTALAHEGLAIGRTAGNQLVGKVVIQQPIILPRSIYPALPGWTGIDPALNSASASKPLENFFTLDPGMDIEFRVVAADPELKVFTSSGFLQIGQAFRLGKPSFDRHVFWTIPSGIPGQVYTASVVFRDRSDFAVESDPVAISFTPEFCPADFNYDGFVDAIDYDRFVEAWLSLDPAADLNVDEFVDAIDLDYFILHFVGGC